MTASMKPKNCVHTAALIAAQVQGELVGDPHRKISHVTSLEQRTPGSVYFVKGHSPRAVEKALHAQNGSTAFINNSLRGSVSDDGNTLIFVSDPQRAVLEIIPLFFQALTFQVGTHPTAVIAEDAVVSKSATIGPFCVIDSGATIGDSVILHSGVTIGSDAVIKAHTVLFSGVIVRERCIVGTHCILQNNVIVGADGFGYIPDKVGGFEKVPQVGTVEIGDHVEIGANSCIDRAALGVTRVGHGTKIDNLVQVGHNTAIGRNCIICAHVGIAGSATIGDHVVLGGFVGVADHVKVVSGVRVGGKSGVTSDVLEPGDYAGYPVQKISDWRRSVARQMSRNRRRKT